MTEIENAIYETLLREIKADLEQQDFGNLRNNAASLHQFMDSVRIKRELQRIAEQEKMYQQFSTALQASESYRKVVQ